MDSLDGLRETVAKAICRHVYTRENTRVSDLERDAADEIIELVRQALSTPTLSGVAGVEAKLSAALGERDEARAELGEAIVRLRDVVERAAFLAAQQPSPEGENE